MGSSGRLAPMYVSNYNDVDMNYFLSHFSLDLVVISQHLSGDKIVVKKLQRKSLQSFWIPPTVFK